MRPMGLPSGVFGGGMNGAIATLLGGMQQQQVPMQQPPHVPPPVRPEFQPTNIFGIKGKLGHLMGRIGDAFLMSGGLKPNYADARQRYDMAGVMEGFASNPLEAIRKMAEFDQPTAMKMYEQLEDQKKNEAAAADKDADNKRQGTELSAKGYPIFGGMARTANATNWDMFRPELQRVNDAFGLGKEIPTAYTEGWAEQQYEQSRDPDKYATAESLDRDRIAKNKIAAARVGVAAANVRMGAARVKAGVDDDEVDNANAERRTDIYETKPTKGGKSGGKGPSAAVKGKVGGGSSGGAKYKVQGGNLFERQADGSYKFKRKA